MQARGVGAEVGAWHRRRGHGGGGMGQDGVLTQRAEWGRRWRGGCDHAAQYNLIPIPLRLNRAFYYEQKAGTRRNIT